MNPHDDGWTEAHQHASEPTDTPAERIMYELESRGTWSHSMVDRVRTVVDRELAAKEQELATLRAKLAELQEYQDSIQPVLAKSEADLIDAKSALRDALQREHTVSTLTRSYCQDRMAGYDTLTAHDWDSLVAWHEDNGETLIHNVLTKVGEMGEALDEANEEIATLRAKLDAAPHGRVCAIFALADTGIDIRHACNCWKSK